MLYRFFSFLARRPDRKSMLNCLRVCLKWSIVVLTQSDHMVCLPSYCESVIDRGSKEFVGERATSRCCKF